jgi:archaemetzincin
MRLLNFIILLILVSCNNAKKADPIIANESSYFNYIEKNDIKLGEPKESEWLYSHKEEPQTFENYTLQNPKTLNDSQNIIYLKPIGQFDPIQKKALELTREYLSIFYQTKTILLATITDTQVPKHSKRLRENNNVQLLAPYILDTMLAGQTPKNSIAFMAFTSKDLYPESSWNYVFGLASYTKRVGVSSIYRLQNKVLDSNNFKLCLKRLINISSHEIGHMFTIGHCTFAKCTMNGSNTMQETDLCPNRLCSECQKKLFWNIKYNNKKRLTELCNFFSANWLSEDYGICIGDLEGLE